MFVDDEMDGDGDEDGPMALLLTFTDAVARCLFWDFCGCFFDVVLLPNEKLTVVSCSGSCINIISLTILSMMNFDAIFSKYFYFF